MVWREKIIRPWVNDVLAGAFVVSMAVALYFSQATRLSLSMDGFLLTFLKQSGDLQAFNIDEIKEPGRPFLGLAWHLASLLTGGTVAGYNAFMFLCITISALLVYVLVRTLLPSQPVWAFLVGAFKIVWCANYEVFDNSGLAIYFAETLFWLALWLFTVLALRHDGMSRFEICLACIVMAFCLLVSVGTYQTSWPVFIIAPPSLIWLGATRIRRSYTCRGLTIWYVATLSMMAWSYYVSHDYVVHLAPTWNAMVSRFFTGLWASTVQALLIPFAPKKGYSSYGISPLTAVTSAIFAAVLAYTGMQSWPSLREKSREEVVRATVSMAMIALLVIASSLMPPLLKWTPVHGTRLIYWSSMGTVLGVVAILVCLFRMSQWIGGGLGAVVAVVLFAGMAQQTLDVGNHYASNGFLNRRFWEDLSMDIPNVDEGTVVLMNGPPAGISTVDEFSTFVFRALTETHLSFFITDGKPSYDSINKSYEVTSAVDMGQRKPYVPPSKYHRYPKVLAQRQTFQVPASRVVWVEWDMTSRRLQVIPERSAMQRIRSYVPSTFGQVLFPRRTIESNRARMQ